MASSNPNEKVGEIAPLKVTMKCPFFSLIKTIDPKMSSVID